jgi:hypothetical protein
MTKIFQVSKAMAEHLPSGDRTRMTDLEIADALNLMKRRCFGVRIAMQGLNSIHDIKEGVLTLTADLADEMEALADAVGDEYKLRFAEEKA